MVKGHLLQRKRAFFTIQKNVSYNPKEPLLNCVSYIILREFGIRKGLKKLVISSKIRIFIGENQ